MTGREWWLAVVNETYSTTELITIEPHEMPLVVPETFDMLYADTLKKLVAWRDNNGGPKIGVLCNGDDRVHKVLKGKSCHDRSACCHVNY